MHSGASIGRGKGERQIIATNVDTAFIVQAVDRDFNINRIERYLTICNASNVGPVIVLNKIDLLEPEAINAIIESVKLRIEDVRYSPSALKPEKVLRP
ncbi:MAG: GTPase RsgA [Flavobacteriales bacterium]|nr:GTPase RsgA [Flavobacteriales bacterium]